jgi:hypothetical protein
MDGVIAKRKAKGYRVEGFGFNAVDTSLSIK